MEHVREKIQAASPNVMEVNWMNQSSKRKA